MLLQNRKNYIKIFKTKSIFNTQDFLLMLNNVPISEDEEDVSYDAGFLFINIPIKAIKGFICEEIYVQKKLELICKKPMFKKRLYKLITECTFSHTRNKWIAYLRETHCQ